MPYLFASTLESWQGFYQVIGESSATLTGLMFVAVTMGSRSFKATTIPVVRAMINPILSYFTTALVVSAGMCIPTQRSHVLAGELTVVGIVGLYRLAALFMSMRTVHRRLPLAQRDWVTNAGLPAGSYLGILAAAAGLLFHESWALSCLGYSVLTLIVIGVVDAWEITLRIMVISPEEIAEIEKFDTFSPKKRGW